MTGTGAGLTLQKPHYDSEDSEESEDDDEKTVELKRLRLAVQEYKLKYQALRKEVEAKEYMDVDAFFKNMEQTGAADGDLPAPEQSCPKVSKFWTDSGFDVFSEYIPPEEQQAVTTQHDAGTSGTPVVAKADQPNPKGAKFWTDSSFDVFSEYIPPEEEEDGSSPNSHALGTQGTPVIPEVNEDDANV